MEKYLNLGTGDKHLIYNDNDIFGKGTQGLSSDAEPFVPMAPTLIDSTL